MYRILKPKNIRRLINLIALIAPIIYLFATQIFALAGAHGEEIIKTEATDYVDDLTVVKDNVTYQRVFYADSAFLDLGRITEDSIYFGYGVDSLSFNSAICSDFINMWNGTYDVNVVETDTFICFDSHVSSYLFSFTDYSLPVDCCFSYLYVDGSEWYYYQFFYHDSLTCYLITFEHEGVVYQPSYEDVFLSLHRNVYFGAKYLPLNDEYDNFQYLEDLQSAYIPFTPPKIPSGSVPQSYSDSLFGTMFPQNNFLEKFGSDSLNDEYGFKPMNDLISVVDSVADIGGTQLGRMAYGYLAYCGYVLLLNLVAGVLVFFFTWPDMIMDKLHGGID